MRGASVVGIGTANTIDFALRCFASRETRVIRRICKLPLVGYVGQVTHDSWETRG